MSVRYAQRQRLLLTTNIPTPYRLAFFRVLAAVLADEDIDFEVLYYAATEPNRRWSMDLTNQCYRWSIVPGLHPAVGGIYPHVNPTMPLLVRLRHPTWILMAGAWNTPSSLLVASRLLSGPGYRIFWSEGHAQAVLHPTGIVAKVRRRCLRRFDGFAVPNQLSEDFIHEELGGGTCVRLPNTVEEDFFLAGGGTDRAVLRARLGLLPDDVALLCVAELSDRKGVRELARAASLLSPEQRRRAIFIFAGDGPLRPDIEAVGGEVRLRLLGHVGQELVRDWMHAADLFILPSKIDPNPLSAIEAAFCGIPLIMSARAGNVNDLVGAGDCGWTLPSLEPEAIASVLGSAIELAPHERRALGARARDVATSHFSRRQVAERFAHDLTTVFPPHSPPGSR